MKWIIKSFEELRTEEFHDILQLRINVFVVEQDCPYPELDNKDKKAYHFFCVSDENKVVAYTRLFKPGDYYKQAAIGRVVVHKEFREGGLGYELMKNSIHQIETLFDTTEIKIGAQTYLKRFYESLGFNKVGEDYIEDGIPHIFMIRN